MDHDVLYRKIEHYVNNLFTTSPSGNLPYHNLNHTESVVKRSQEIASHYSLSDNDMLVLYAAAWFHDTGYLVGEPLMHEERGAKLMRDFMQEQTTDESLINNIEECILSTKGVAEPKNLLQQIIKDADTYNFGSDEFKDTNKRVFKEYNERVGRVSKTEWAAKTIELLEGHHYYTSYCKDLLTGGKKKHIKQLKKKLEKGGTEEVFKMEMPPLEKNVLKAANNLTSKGIQTMLRLTSENHMKLSDMADGKANLLISVNAIIISVILSVLLRKLQVETYLTIPTILFLTSSVSTIVVAILATRPKINEGTFSEEDIINKKTNLLFFGNFYKTSREQYEQAMSKMMADPEYLYSSLVKDIYYLGLVIARKYKLIRWAYNIFMVGIILSVIAFALAAVFNTGVDGVVTDAQGAPL